MRGTGRLALVLQFRVASPALDPSTRTLIIALAIACGPASRHGPPLTWVSRLRVSAPIRTVVVVRLLAQPREGAFVGSADDAFVVRAVSSFEAERALRAARCSSMDLADPGLAASRESTESPHSIALQVATVRYIVQMKPALTCEDAQSPWSAFWRVLLCKQGVAGSSPVVSTENVLVKDLRVDLSRCVSHRPCPLRAQNWRVVAVDHGHGRLLTEPFEVAHDVGVLAVDDVLVAEGGGR